MVRSSGTSETAPPSSSFSRPPAFQPAKSAHRSIPSTSSTSSEKRVAAAPHVSSDYPERRPSTAQTEHSAESSRTIRGNRSIDRFSGITEGTSRRSRSNSVDVSIAVATATVVTTSSPVTALRIRPVLQLRSHSTDTLSQTASVSSSPQRRRNSPWTSSGTNSSITTPSTGTSEGSQSWKSSPQRLRTNPDHFLPNSPLVAPHFEDSKRAYPKPSLGSPIAPALAPKHPPTSSSSHPSRTGGKRSRQLSGKGPHKIKDLTKAQTREHRSYSQKAMLSSLSSALDKANTAVKLDNAENYEGAMEAYRDACALLSQVMSKAGGDEDKRKLQAIQETYTQRIEELRNLSPRPTGTEKELPARPFTEEFTDQESLYLPEDDESTIIASTATATSVVGNTKYTNGASMMTAAPLRRDSLFLCPDPNTFSDPVPPLPMSRSRSADYMPAPLSPGRPPRSPKRDGIIESDGLSRGLFENNNRESFTFGAAALSPRFSPAKEHDYGIRRSVSDASSVSSRRSSQRQSGLSSNNTHSRQGSEVSTSWLNTIDESGGSVSGESSPGWTKKKPRKQSNRELRREKEREIMRQFEEDFDSQLDAAVEAAYDDGYEVDYTYDRDDDMLVMRSPRMNVEKAKERDREVEREVELESQREKERQLERERLGFSGRRRDSDVGFFDDEEGNESEEDRILEEMTRGYRLDDFEFNLESKTALPRRSASTTYSDSTLPRESGSSGYSSGTTWASSISSAHMSNGTLLTTVTEAPLTPPPPPPSHPPLPPPSSLPPQVPPPPPPLIPAPLAPPAQKTKEPLPALPNPNIAAIPGLAVTKSSSVRSRRLSALAEPLKVETSASNTVSSSNTAIPTTLVRGPSPQPGATDSVPPSELPPLPPASPPSNAIARSASAAAPSSRPGTSSGFGDGPLPDPPASARGVSGRKISSPTPPALEPPGLSVPLTKTVSDDGGASGSPARYTPRIPGIPGSLRQIQSSASLKSRNVGSPDTESPGTPHNGLFSSSSTSNLRKAFPRSATPAMPTIVPNTPMGAPPTAGLPAGGMHLFDSKLHSPATPGSEEALTATIPSPLEPCPPEPLSKPFWLMRCFYQTVAHPRGGYISARLFVPREVWFIKGVKIRAVDDKISACDLASAALAKLATVKHDINALFEEMQSLEGVLERAQAILSKKLGNEVGAVGARSLYHTENTISEGNAHDMVTKSTSVSGGKSYFSLRKLRTKTSNTTLSSFASSPGLVGAGDFYGSGTGLPMAGASADSSTQPKRDLDGATFGGPHAAYISALARLFDAAQILDRLPVFDEENLKKTPLPTKVGLELSHRHAVEFFGFFICRFVLADVSLLLDKFVKRGSEWVAT